MARSSKKESPGEKKHKSHGGQLDVLAGYDTRYVRHETQRRLPGNGERPKNPFGREVPEPESD